MRKNLHTILFIRENSGTAMVILPCHLFLNTLAGQYQSMERESCEVVLDTDVVALCINKTRICPYT